MPRPGGLPFKTNVDACRFAVGCELQILVSQRVFGMESYHILPIQVSLSTVYNEIYKNVLPLITEKSSLEVSLSLSHTYISLHKGFNLNFLTSFRVTRREHHAR